MYLMSLADPWEIYGILRASSKFPVAQMVESPCNAGDPGSIPGFGRSPGEGNGTLLQYPCLKNPMDGGAWQATVHGVTKSRTQLSDLHTHGFIGSVLKSPLGTWGHIVNNKLSKIIIHMLDSGRKEK